MDKQLTQHKRQARFVYRGSTISFETANLLAKLVTSNCFQVFFAVLIFCNMVVLALHTQYVGLDVGHDLSYSEYNAAANDTWRGGDFWFPMFDWAFGSMYVIEVALKIIGLQRKFPNSMNCFDLFVVCVWVLEKVLELLGDKFPFRPVILRLLRMAKVLRLIRLIHKVAGLEQLFQMMMALKGSLHMLLWSTILLFGCLSFFGFFLNQLLLSVCMENSEVSMETRRECFEYFGTFSRSILSMFELTLANWVPISRFLMEEVSEYFVIFCILYKLTLGFAVVGVINACFIKETFKTVANNRHIMVIEKTNEKAAFQKEMVSLFEHADLSCDGKLSKEEFAQIILDHDVKTWLSALGLNTLDLDKIFDMIDDGSGELTADELVRGIGTLKGQARSLDLSIMASEQEALKLQVQIIDQNLKDLMKEINGSVPFRSRDVDIAASQQLQLQMIDKNLKDLMKEMHGSAPFRSREGDIDLSVPQFPDRAMRQSI